MDCTDLAPQIDSALAALQAQWTQWPLHGLMNVWIVKPGTNSKGSGIFCCNTLTEVLHHCSTAKNRVVQKCRALPSTAVVSALLARVGRVDRSQGSSRSETSAAYRTWTISRSTSA